VLREWRGEHCRDPSATRESQALLGECDQADVGITIAQIEIERDGRREQMWRCAEVHKQRVAPVGQEQSVRRSHRSPLKNLQGKSSAPRAQQTSAQPNLHRFCGNQKQ